MLGNTGRFMECHPWKSEPHLANRPHISMVNWTNSICVAVHLLSNKSQMSNMNQKSGAQTKIGDLVILTPWSITKQTMATWNLSFYKIKNKKSLITSSIRLFSNRLLVTENNSEVAERFEKSREGSSLNQVHSSTYILQNDLCCSSAHKKLCDVYRVKSVLNARMMLTIQQEEVV